MVLVKHILEGKGTDIYSVSSNTKIIDALRLMSENNIGAVLVMEGDKVAGIFSERDYSRKVVLLGKSSKDTEVNEVMTTKVMFVTPNETVEECMFLMTEKHFRHLPVLRDDKLVGLISIGDVVKAVIDKKEFIINELVRYIQGYA